MSFTLPSANPKLNDENEQRRIANGIRELAKGNLAFQGEFKMIPLTITNADSPFTITSIPVLLANASAAPITVNLPPAASASGRTYFIKKADSTGNDVTIDGDGTETIDGAATLILSTAWTKTIIYCDGTQWLTLA